MKWPLGFVGGVKRGNIWVLNTTRLLPGLYYLFFMYLLHMSGQLLKSYAKFFGHPVLRITSQAGHICKIWYSLHISFHNKRITAYGMEMHIKWCWPRQDDKDCISNCINWCILWNLHHMFNIAKMQNKLCQNDESQAQFNNAFTWKVLSNQ